MEKDNIKWIHGAPAQGLSVVLLTPVDIQMPRTHVSIVLTFTSAPNEAQQLLEQSLSTALLHYAEFAGRLGENESGRKCIYLNNAGVPFVTAKLDADMAPYMKNKGNDVDALLASSHSSLTDQFRSLPLLLQFTRFNCGGVTIGIQRHHQVADGTSSAQFFLEWATCTRTGSMPVGVPKVHNRSVVMPREPPKPEFEHPEYARIKFQEVSNENLTTFCIHFSVEELARLKADAGGSFSTFVSLSTHLWKMITKERNLTPETKTACTFSVDGRRRLSAGPDFFGNAVFAGMTLSTSKEVLELPLQTLAEMVQHSIQNTLRTEYLQSAIDFIAIKHEAKTDITPLGTVFAGHMSIAPDVIFTSWLRFPLYDIDFGFGNPTSLATQGFHHTIGLIILVPSSKKDGSVDVLLTETKERAEALKSLMADNMDPAAN